MKNKLPLEGIKVLELSHIIAGPFCASLLGDMGAEVIKVERPGRGDEARHFDAVFPGSDSSYFLGLNRNKRAMTVNLQSPRGREIVLELCRSRHVVIENFRVGVLQKLGLAYEDVQRVNPSVIYVSLSAFGQSGPLSRKPGMDILVQAISGIMGLTGEKGRPPAKVGAPIADFVGSYLACFAVMLGLRVMERDGIGQKIDLSLLDGQLLSLANYLPGFFVTGKPDVPVGSGHPQIVPYQVFSAKDMYIVVACLTEEFWRKLCRALDKEYLSEDPRFKTNHDRALNREILLPLLEGEFLKRTGSEWMELLERFDIPCGPVNSLKDILNHPQTRENGMVVDLQHPTAGRIRVSGNPIHLHQTPAREFVAAPLLGEHTYEILRELGYDEDQIVSFREKAII